MKKSSLIFALLFMANSVVFADGPTPAPPGTSPSIVAWETILTTEESSLNEEGFEILQQRYSNIFGAMDSHLVESASVLTEELMYVGFHSCSEGDSRLRTKIQSYGWCEKSCDGQSGVCASGWSDRSHPTHGDPCGDDDVVWPMGR